MADIIILDGLSRTGKSTIANRMESFGYKSISIKSKMPDYINNYADFYNGMHLMTNAFLEASPNDKFILDRSFLSAIVYAQFFNRPTHVDNGSIISDLLSKNKFVLIYLTTSHQSYLDRSPKDRIVYNKKEFDIQRNIFDNEFDMIKNKIEDVQWKSNFIKINTEEQSIADCLHIIKKQINLKTNNHI